jgi:hypothetical protein
MPDDGSSAHSARQAAVRETTGHHVLRPRRARGGTDLADDKGNPGARHSWGGAEQRGRAGPRHRGALHCASSGFQPMPPGNWSNHSGTHSARAPPASCSVPGSSWRTSWGHPSGDLPSCRHQQACASNENTKAQPLRQQACRKDRHNRPTSTSIRPSRHSPRRSALNVH